MTKVPGYSNRVIRVGNRARPGRSSVTEDGLVKVKTKDSRLITLALGKTYFVPECRLILTQDEKRELAYYKDGLWKASKS
jgi:hypothetical protein